MVVSKFLHKITFSISGGPSVYPSHWRFMGKLFHSLHAQPLRQAAHLPWVSWNGLAVASGNRSHSAPLLRFKMHFNLARCRFITLNLLVSQSHGRCHQPIFRRWFGSWRNIPNALISKLFLCPYNSAGLFAISPRYFPSKFALTHICVIHNRRFSTDYCEEWYFRRRWGNDRWQCMSQA